LSATAKKITVTVVKLPSLTNIDQETANQVVGIDVQATPHKSGLVEIITPHIVTRLSELHRIKARDSFAALSLSVPSIFLKKGQYTIP
jgi:hypothetical protein